MSETPRACGLIEDLRRIDANRVPFALGYCLTFDADGRLSLVFTTKDGKPRAVVMGCLIDGLLAIDVIDCATLGPDDVPCGAEAVASAEIDIVGESCLLGAVVRDKKAGGKQS